ncbi:MAG: four helix bundle protein [Acidobacteriota bacterium]
MRPHHNLDVWKKAVAFTVDIYSVTERFPRDERFGLTSQIRRASVSIAANIAEGAGRKSSKEFVNFLSIAQGSASEVETELLIAHRLDYLREKEMHEISAKLDEIGRMLTGLSSYLKSKNQK